MKILWCTVVSFCVLVPAASSQAAPVLKVGHVTAKAGETVTIPISLDPASPAITSVQFDLTLPSAVSTGTVTIDPALTSEGKTVNAALRGNQWRFIIFGINQTSFGKNKVLTAQVMIAPGTPAGTLTLPLANVVFADSKGASIPSGKNIPGKIIVKQP